MDKKTKTLMARAGDGRTLRLAATCAALCIGMAVNAQPSTGIGAGAATGTSTGTAAGHTGSAGERAGHAKGNLARADTAFMKQAAEHNHAEIESSRLTVQKARDPTVKAFAQQMVTDHGKTGQELAALASAKGVELPDGPSMMQKAKLKLLEAADGADFDRRYSETMGLAAHRDTIALFQKASKGARDADVKAFATKTLPALQHHLEMAQKLPSVKVEAGRDSKKR
jgi:putative membrane protein